MNQYSGLGGMMHIGFDLKHNSNRICVIAYSVPGDYCREVS